MTLAVPLALISSAAAQSNEQDARKNQLAASYYASTERFGYTGTVTVYDTLANAMHHNHARSAANVVPQRDGSLYVVENAPAFDTDFDEFLTNWYDDAAHDNAGTDYPNNTDFGFIQLADGLQGEPTTWINHIGYWNKDHDAFTVKVTGANATYPNNFTRLWNAGYADVGGEGTRGTFLTYQFTLHATGMHAVNQGNDFYTNIDNPTDYSGSFYGIFHNTSTTSPESNGYYVVQLWFNNVSWAASNGFALNDAFGSNIAKNGEGHDGE
jgi:hypothetical protein